MKTFFNENKQLLTSFLAISIILPIIILTPSPTGFISYETGLTTIGYCGSILGGFLTLYGVWWTIKKQDEQRCEDLAMQYKPIFALTFSHSLIHTLPRNNTATLCYFTLKNVGRGEATNINIEYPRNISPYSFMISYEINQIITPENTCYLMINISKLGKRTSEDTYEITSLNEKDRPVLPISIKFNDCFGNQYIYNYTISFEYQTTINSQEVKAFTIKDSIPILELKNPSSTKIIEPSWIATISNLSITFINRQ